MELLEPQPLIFEKSRPGARAARFPAFADGGADLDAAVPAQFRRREAAGLPELSEIEVVRHFTRLSQLNFSVDTHFYPLGSCTMKYNPKVNDRMAALPGFAAMHPYQPAATAQGALELLDDLEHLLCEICGMDRFSLQPAAGAHGEFTGLLVIRAHLKSKGQGHRNKVLVPDSAHGTNPSSARQAGFDVVTVPSLPSGQVDVSALERLAGPDTAALMLTNPNTLGVFESRIGDMAAIIHRAGGLLYYDGANMNALLGLARPGDMGFDVVHLNLHKSFSTPHGGGGPGAGPVGVKAFLDPYLPVPRLRRVEGALAWDHDRPQSVGRVRSFAGNFGILVRAYTYIRAHGAEGMERNSRAAIINANYLKAKVRARYREAAPGPCMHEFVVVPDEAIARGIKVADIAKRLLDFGFHSPTLSWPIRNCLMIEPTETESRETLDRFADALTRIADEAASDPEKVRSAPHRLPVRRMDEVAAARNLDLRA